MVREEDETRRAVSWGTWKRIYAFAHPHRRYFVLLLIAATAMAATDTVYPLITRELIDRIAAGRDLQLQTFALAYAAVTLLLGVEVWGFIHLAEHLGKRISLDIRMAAFKRMQELPFSYFDRRPSGWLMTRMTADCDRLSHIVAWGTFDLAWGGTSLLAIGVVMFMLNWRLAAVVLLVVPPLVVLSRHFQRMILSSARAVRKANSEVTASYSEALMGIRTIKAFGRERESFGRCRQGAGRLYAAGVENALHSALYLPLILTLGSVGTGLALVYGGFQALAGTLSVGTLIAFITYSRQFFEPVQEVAAIMAELQMAQAAAERVLELIETEPAISDLPAVRERIRLAAGGGNDRSNGDGRRKGGESAGARPLADDGLPRDFETLEFRHVSFAYGAGRPVLEDFNLRLRADETIALVGATGAGKSTIASLLCRFYEPTAGEILFDGVDYRERSVAWLKSITSVVLQAPHLFRGSVRENIRYGRLDASDAEVEETARLVAAHDLILGLESGYDTDVGESGGRLSSGQRQLVSLARAVIRQPRILVLDEATSAVDGETEARIQRGLDSALRGRLSVIIAHRLTTVRKADRILVIADGRVAEQGSHQALMATGGIYRRLYVGQSMKEKVRRWEASV
jgi:ATP-binding cassette subfamily B protein